MKRLIGVIPLQNQDAWPFGVVGVVLDQHGGRQPVDDVAHSYIVSGEFLVTVQ